MGEKKIRVVYFQRKRRKAANFSIEIYYAAIRKSLPPEFIPEVVTMPFESSGLLKRLFNTIYCVFKQGDINHITGDIHYAGILLRRKKTILTVLDCGMLNNPVNLKYRIYKLFWYTLPLERVNYITVISEATRKDLLRHVSFPNEKVKTIYVCISDAFKRNTSVFNKQNPVVLQIGTAPNKNLSRLIPALAGLNCKLVIVGKIAPEISGLLAEHKVEYENLIGISEEEMIQQYSRADIISFASTLEGFGMPIVEANTVGRVVITGNVASMPEIAADAAHLVDPFDVESIRQGFIKVINDDAYRVQLIENGYRNAERFQLGKIVNEHVHLYKSLVS